MDMHYGGREQSSPSRVHTRAPLEPLALDFYAFFLDMAAHTPHDSPFLSCHATCVVQQVGELDGRTKCVLRQLFELFNIVRREELVDDVAW